MSYIYMVYTWYILGYTIYIHQTGYHDGISLDIPCISTKYIHGISMNIHGISFDVYTWYIRGISWYIHGYSYFLKPDFAAGPCCWSNSMRTRVWVIKSVSLHLPPWQLCQGKRQPTKGSTRLPPTFPLCRLRRR